MRSIPSLIVVAAAAAAALTVPAALAQNSFGEAANVQGAPTGATPPQTSAQPVPSPAPRSAGTTPSPGANPLDALAAEERRDFGVPPSAALHAGAMHGPTPASIPGGQLITTKGLVELTQGGQGSVLLLDVLGGQEMIRGAVYAVPAAQSGSFDDQTQQQFGQFLKQATGGNAAHPIVAYCLSPECWMSYNAALRAIHLGYTNVLWYRGGIEAWKRAGLPTQAPSQ